MQLPVPPQPLILAQGSAVIFALVLRAETVTWTRAVHWAMWASAARFWDALPHAGGAVVMLAAHLLGDSIFSDLLGSSCPELGGSCWGPGSSPMSPANQPSRHQLPADARVSSEETCCVLGARVQAGPSGHSRSVCPAPDLAVPVFPLQCGVREATAGWVSWSAPLPGYQGR